MQLKDHRQIGQEQDLFSFHEVAPGAVFWHNKGWIVYQILKNFIQTRLENEGYEIIFTPAMVKSQLFKESGHWDFYQEHMFNFEIEKELYSLKPMNCPEATLVFKNKTRSYHDLPVRLAEFGILHRNELSGVLGGLFRVRQFTIDDAHHFIRADQIQEEINKLIDLVKEFYASFGFSPHFYFATKPDKAMGDSKLWGKAEKDLEVALKNAKIKYDVKPKDGAFYGPKIDIHIKDSQDRDWQLATIQLDFQMPERFKLTYIDEEGKGRQPVMLHIAFFGSFERFIGILIEHYQGAFPLWLAPVQAVIIPITDKQVDYAGKIYKELKNNNIRVELDSRSETMQSKVRDATLQKVPYMLIIGEKEVKDNSVSVRTRKGEDLGKQNLEDFLKKLKEEIETKSAK